MTMCAITKQCINLSKVCIITWTTWTADSSKTSIKKQPTWDTPVSQSNQSAASLPTWDQHSHTPAVYNNIKHNHHRVSSFMLSTSSVTFNDVVTRVDIISPMSCHSTQITVSTIKTLIHKLHFYIAVAA